MGIVQRSFFGVKPGRKTRIAPKGKRICVACEKAKPLSAFTKSQQYYCKECVKANGEKYRAQGKASSWLRRYGLSEQAYWDLFEQQGGVCAICGQPETRIHRGTLAHLSVDHDHTTGMIRGLLCYKCNVGIGQLGDSVTLLECAIRYLRGSGNS